jgi:hypothetical protein
MMGDVSVERKGKKERINVKHEADSSKRMNQIAMARIKKIIDKKESVLPRPSQTALLIFFDDYTRLRYDHSASRLAMSKFIRSINRQVQSQYSNIYIVGASGQSFYEKH